MAPDLRPIDPKLPRWEPMPDPNDIVIPGLDTAAPPYDQIEQIEQLITIKLQHIDANFSKIQHVMANRILPAVKKYAVGTQPVREAAKFWTTFYEQAAQIRIPTYDDYTGQVTTEDEAQTTQTESESGPTDDSTHSDQESEGATPNPSRTFNPDGTSSEVSFAPGQAAFSSTPATVSRARAMRPHDSFVSQGTEPMPSWSASLESPLLQLNREIQSLAEDRQAAVPPTSVTHHTQAYDASQDLTQRPIQYDTHQDESSILRSIDKGKAREGPQTLRHDVLRRNANTSTATASTSRTTSPLKFKPKTPVLKSLNPYLPPDSNPVDWKGVVDLKDPSITSPQRPGSTSSIKLATFKPSAAIGITRARNKTPPPSGDDSFDDNFGMSPPVMTDYARLPTLGRTPRKEAAERIMKSLVDVEHRGVFGPVGAAQRGAPPKASGYGTESSMSSMPTPPSVTHYNRPSYPRHVPSETSDSVVDASLDSIMRRVGLNVPGYGAQQAPSAAPAVAPLPGGPVFAPPASRQPVVSSVSFTSSLGSIRSAASRSIFQPHVPAPAPPPPPPPEPEPVQTPQPRYDFYDDDVIGPGTGEDLDDDDSMDSLYNDPNAPPFVFAPSDDSFDDDSFDDSMDDETGTGEAFLVAQGDDDFDDDSFDDVGYGEGEEETVFGVPPAQRLQQPQFRMLGEDLLQDTIGIGAQMQIAGRVEESPTPWNANARG